MFAAPLTVGRLSALRYIERHKIRIFSACQAPSPMTFAHRNRSAPHLDAPSGVAASPYQSKKSDPYSSHSIILGLAGSGAGRRLLDVGAAHGYLAETLRSQGFQVTGIEADPVLGEAATKHCDELYCSI